MEQSYPGVAAFGACPFALETSPETMERGGQA